MIVVGLTGGIASGKSTVSAELLNKGYVVIDADLVARQVLDIDGEAYGKVVKEFGPLVEGLVEENGSLNRAALGTTVFRDKTLLKKLNGITHPAIITAIFKQVMYNWWIGTKVLILDVPLLFETKLNMLCHVNLVISVNEKSQLERLLKRNPDLSYDEAVNRIKAQMSMEEKRSRANVIINNDGTKDQLTLKVAKFTEFLGSIRWPLFTFLQTHFWFKTEPFEI